MTRNFRPVLWLTLFMLAGCGSDAPTSPSTDFITLTSIVPSAGTTLTAGARVTFTAVVDCTLVSADAGHAAMLLQDQRSVTLAPGEVQPQASLVKGTTTLTFTQTVTIPEAGSTVVVALPIFTSGSNVTAALVRREYSVR